jgi:hypothetical protein
LKEDDVPNKLDFRIAKDLDGAGIGEEILNGESIFISKQQTYWFLRMAFVGI